MLAATTLGAAAIAWSAPAPAPFMPALCSMLRIRRRLAGPGIAITFDDGPHPRGTPAVLDRLAAHGAIGTFFLVGEQVARNPALAGEIVAAGHQVALHGYRHNLLLRRLPSALADDLRRAVATIEDATGHTPTSYRPPYGVFSTGGLRLSRRRGWEPTLWSRWGRDWEARTTPEAIVRRAADGLVAGDIVLLHDADDYSAPGSWRRTVAALPAILEAALATGEALVPLTPVGPSE